ncbi:MAG: DUF4920 domain-containing protein [Planctomycetota bacterium]
MIRHAFLAAFALLASTAVAALPTTRPAMWMPIGIIEDASMVLVPEEDMVLVRDVLADPQKFAGQEITIAGEISAVCQKAGCWVKLVPSGTEPKPTKGVDTNSVFVKLTCPKDGFLVPADSARKQVLARGKVLIEQISEADARHYAEDDGATPAEIAAITGPQTIVRFETLGVMVSKGQPSGNSSS